jgi:GNAT superfamily N-acetyltransferase
LKDLAINPMIELWIEDHPRWNDLIRLIEKLDQTRWVESRYDWHQSSHMLVAVEDEQPVGFLRFVIQEIGVEDDRPSVTLDDKPLLEAKVLAFGVHEDYRNRGIGRALQESAIAHAAEMGCYQLRSHSSGSNRANHHLKLQMGFAVMPIIRGEDREGAYFIMPLKRLSAKA